VLKHFLIIASLLAYGFLAFSLGRFSVRPGVPTAHNDFFIYKIDLGTAPGIGSASAPVVIEEFSDFECPFCAKAEKELNQVLERFPKSVRLVYKHYPLSMHPYARSAAAAAIAAGEQGKFWEMHDLLFASKGDLGDAALQKYAAQLQLDLPAFDKWRTSSEVQSTIDNDIAEGTRLNVGGTPTFFINGRRLDGAVPYSEFKKYIDQALMEARQGPPSNSNRLWNWLAPVLHAFHSTQPVTAQ